MSILQTLAFSNNAGITGRLPPYGMDRLVFLREFEASNCNLTAGVSAFMQRRWSSNGIDRGLRATQARACNDFPVGLAVSTDVALGPNQFALLTTACSHLEVLSVSGNAFIDEPLPAIPTCDLTSPDMRAPLVPGHLPVDQQPVRYTSKPRNLTQYYQLTTTLPNGLSFEETYDAYCTAYPHLRTIRMGGGRHRLCVNDFVGPIDPEFGYLVDTRSPSSWIGLPSLTELSLDGADVFQGPTDAGDELRQAMATARLHGSKNMVIPPSMFTCSFSSSATDY